MLNFTLIIICAPDLLLSSDYRVLNRLLTSITIILHQVMSVCSVAARRTYDWGCIELFEQNLAKKLQNTEN